MKTLRMAQSVERTFLNYGRMERNCLENLGEYESDVLDRAMSQSYAFGNSVNLPSMLLISNRNGFA